MSRKETVGEAPGGRTRRLRRWKGRLLLALASCSLTLLVAEIALRVAGVATPGPPALVGQHRNRPSVMFVADPETGWRMRPSRSFVTDFEGRRIVYHSDRRGFRHDPGAPAARVHKRLVLVGDSYAFGYRVRFQESFGALLAEHLGGWELHNLGMPGFGLDQVWLSLRHQALLLRPDLVVVGLFRDDFKRSLTAFRGYEGFNKPTFVLDGGRLRRRTWRDRPGAVIDFLERSSHVWAAGILALRRLGRLVPVGTWWRLNQAVLDAMRKDCSQHSVPVLFVRIPFPDWSPFPTLNRYMERTDAMYLDPAGHAPADPRSLYLRADPHLSRKGHAWLASEIARWLRQSRPDLFE